MTGRISTVALVVRDYDEAIHFFTQSLAFELLEDTPQADGKRWVRVAPRGAGDTALLLAGPRRRTADAQSATRPAVASSCSWRPTTSTANTNT